MRRRFVDDGRRLKYFANNTKIHCPNCQKCATMIYFFNNKRDTKIICGHCGLNKMEIGNEVEVLDKEKLYLKTKCCGETLWFLNKEHLLYVKAFVEADLREQPIPSTYSLIAKLPFWIKDKHNREKILKSINKLEQIDCR